MSFATEETRWCDVYLVAGARAVTVCGDVLAATSLALAFQSAGASGKTVSALLLAAALPIAALAPIAGRIADRVDSRTILVVAGFTQAAVCLVLAFTTSTPLVIGLVALLACGLAITSPTLAALLPEMVRRQDLARASGLTQTAHMIGMMAAPALAGVLVGQFGVRVPLLLDALSYLALVAAGLLLRTRRRGVDRAAEAAPVTWRISGDRLFTTMIVAVAVTVAGVGAINVIEVFFVRETLGASTTMFGVIAACWTLGMVGGSLLFGRLLRDVADPVRLVSLSLILMGATCGMVALGAGAWTVLALVPLWILGGLGNGGLNVCTNLVIALRVPSAARGRAFATLGAAVQGAGMIGLVAGGPLVDRFEPRVLVLGAGVAGVVAVLACAPAVRPEKRSRPPSPVGAGRPEIASGDEQRHPASPGRPHPVPELPADLLGSDALGRAARRRSAQG